MSVAVFYLLVILTALQRFAELARSRKNQRDLTSIGFKCVEPKSAYYLMVITHSLWILGMLIENSYFRWAIPNALAWAASSVFLSAQILRLRVMQSLGRQWNTQVMTPDNTQQGVAVITTGPYRFIRHPNYLAVVLEFVSLPIIGGAIWTALIGSIINAILLKSRIRIEEEALLKRPGYAEAFMEKSRIIPGVF